MTRPVNVHRRSGSEEGTDAKRTLLQAVQNTQKTQQDAATGPGCHVLQHARGEFQDPFRIMHKCTA